MTPVLAIVVPVYNEMNMIPVAIQKLLNVLKGMIGSEVVHQDSYIIFVDDGSADDSWRLLSDAYKLNRQCRAIKLSRNFGHNIALLAGLTSIKDLCDVSISIDCDLQQDPSAMHQFLDEFQAGADIVFGIRNDRKTDGFFKKYTALAFYRAMQMMGVKLHTNHADYRLLSRRALNALASYHEPNIFLRAICVDMGFHSASIYFDVVEREHGTSKYSISKMLKFAVDGITSFSALPLRMISVLGIIVFGLSFLMSGYILIKTLFIGGTSPGWASTVLPIYLLGGLQIFCLGVVGEYISQIYAAAKGRPRYIIESELL